MSSKLAGAIDTGVLGRLSPIVFELVKRCHDNFCSILKVRHQTNFGSCQKDEAPGDVDGGHPHHWGSRPQCGRRSRGQRRTDSIGARVKVTKKLLIRQTRVGLKVYSLLVVKYHKSERRQPARGGRVSREHW